MTTRIRALWAEHRARLRGYIVKRVRENDVVDHHRSRESWEELPAGVAAPEAEQNDVAELATCLQPLIADMPETYRTALVLSEIEGLPQKEVANQLHISLSGAKSRVQRGREKLRQRLLECCNIETGCSRITAFEPRDKNCNNGCA